MPPSAAPGIWTLSRVSETTVAVQTFVSNDTSTPGGKSRPSIRSVNVPLFLGRDEGVSVVIVGFTIGRSGRRSTPLSGDGGASLPASTAPPSPPEPLPLPPLLP